MRDTVTPTLQMRTWKLKLSCQRLVSRALREQDLTPAVPSGSRPLAHIISQDSARGLRLRPRLRLEAVPGAAHPRAHNPPWLWPLSMLLGSGLHRATIPAPGDRTQISLAPVKTLALAYEA